LDFVFVTFLALGDIIGALFGILDLLPGLHLLLLKQCDTIREQLSVMIKSIKLSVKDKYDGKIIAMIPMSRTYSFLLFFISASDSAKFPPLPEPLPGS
jgi:hypothetical protein